MIAPQLTTFEENGVTSCADLGRPYGVTLAFTQRMGGVSRPPYSSLNLGLNCADDPSCVEENRRRALKSLGLSCYQDYLLAPHQVHGDYIEVIKDRSPQSIEAAKKRIAKGCDGIVVCTKGVPVMLCFADCVPVILVAPGGFAVVHSGWRGTFAKIAQKAAIALMDETGCTPNDVLCYIGPHIQGEDYEVSGELLDKFKAEFGSIVQVGRSNLRLSAAILSCLGDVGIAPEHIYVSSISTPQNTARFYSYRAEEGLCGRHGAIACLS